MEHTIEPASSGRAKCRGCGRLIGKGELRFGERLPNPFSDGNVMTHWFHLPCAAMKRPDPFLEATSEGTHGVEPGELEHLREAARAGLEHRRLPRVDGAERDPSGRARCRNCREVIVKDTWRVRLVFYEEGMFNPAGFIHLSCCGPYLETTGILDRIAHFSPDLSDADLKSIEKGLDSTT